MAREYWLADSYTLTDGLVRDVEYRDGLYTVQATRGDPPVVANAHGSLPGGKRRKYGPGSFVLKMWGGAPEGGTKQDREAQWEQLVRVLNPARLITFTRGLANGSVRQCLGRVSSPLTPQHIGQLAFRVDAEVNVPGAFWHDVDITSDATAAGAALPKDLLLTTKAAATAPMGDLTYRITGPITNPKVQVTSDATLQDSFTYLAVVPTGQVLEVDGGAFTARLNGIDVDWTKFSWTGDRFLELPTAGLGVTPAVRLSGTGGGATTKLEVLGSGSYLC